MSFGALSRTRILRLKDGTSMAVDKWWKKQRPAAGEVRIFDACDYVIYIRCKQRLTLNYLLLFPFVVLICGA